MNYTEITCPHPDCQEDVHLVWEASRSLIHADVYDYKNSDLREPFTPDTAHTETWRIECSYGHVLLLPGRLGCPCGDPGGDGDPHNEDDYDWSEDSRTFREHDLDRLATVLAALNATESSDD